MFALFKHIPVNALYLYAGSLLASAINYLYNIIMARESFLGPAEFGSLAALTSLLYVGNIAAATLTTTTTKYIAAFAGRDQYNHIGPFLRRLYWLVTFFGLAGGLFLITASPFIARQLHFTSVLPVIILAPIFPLSLLVAISMGTLQGLALFGTMALVFLTASGLRLLLAIPLVGSLSWGISGAILAGLLASLGMYAISLFPLRQYLSIKQVSSPLASGIVLWKELVGYTHQVFWVVLGLTSLLSIDVVLAQHYLPTANASLYGVLSTLGRIIYFVALPVIMVMFPLASKKAALNQSINKIVLMTGAVVCLFAVPFLIAYTIIPQLIIRFSVGAAYQAGADDLWLFGLFFTALTLATWLAYALLALQISIGWIPPAVVLGQVILIAIWHDTPRQIVTCSLVATMLLIALFIIRWQHKKYAFLVFFFQRSNKLR